MGSTGQKHTKYFILNNRGEGLHYIKGFLSWRKPDCFEAIENFTCFGTASEVQDFIADRKLLGDLFIGIIETQIII